MQLTVYVCTYICAYISTNTHTHTHTHTQAHTHTHTYIHTHTHTHTHTHIHIHTHRHCLQELLSGVFNSKCKNLSLHPVVVDYLPRIVHNLPKNSTDNFQTLLLFQMFLPG